MNNLNIEEQTVALYYTKKGAIKVIEYLMKMYNDSVSEKDFCDKFYRFASDSSKILEKLEENK